MDEKHSFLVVNYTNPKEQRYLNKDFDVISEKKRLKLQNKERLKEKIK
jgi:hypothetical protein